MLLFVCAALAQDPETEVDPVLQEAQDVARALAEQIEALSAELEAAQNEANASAEDVARLQALHAAALTLADAGSTPEERAQAANTLAEAGETTFLLHAAMSRDARLARAMLAPLSDHGHFDALGQIVRSNSYARDGVIRVLVRAEDPAAGQVLLGIADDPALGRGFRSDAVDGLKEAYPELLEGKEIDSTASGVGVVSMVGGTGLASGILLSSVGVWGGSEEAIAIGAVGGSLIGAGTGGFYGVTRNVSTGQGLRYASDVSWGLTSSELLTQVVLDPWPIQRDYQANRKRQNKAAAIRAVGTIAGAGIGLNTMNTRDPDPHDVVGSNIAGVGAMQVGMGIVDMTLEQGQTDCYAWEGGQSNCDVYKRWYRSRYAAGLAGSAVGLGTTTLVREQWDPSFRHHVFSGLFAVESTWATMWLHEQSKTSAIPEDALFRTTAAGSVLIGEGLAHGLDIQTHQNLGAIYGILAGNALGAGLPMAFGATEGSIQKTMIPVGIVGTAAGVGLAGRAKFEPGDVTLITAGTPILTAQVAAYGGYANATTPGFNGEQVAGMALTTAALSSAGLGLISQKTSPKSLDVGVIATSAAWGTWFGVLTPIAMELDGDSSTLLLTGAATSQAFMVGTAGVIYGLDVQSRRLLVPQLGAVGGASLGSLGASLANPEHAAKGAVIGSVVGFAGGAIFELNRSPQLTERSFTPRRPHLRIPGQFGFAAAPTALDGETGVWLQLDWRG